MSYDLNDEDEREKLKDAIEEAPTTESLHINRLPRQTVESFKEWAHEDFAGDYGWMLHWLLNRERIRQNVAELEKRIAHLEAALSETEDTDSNREVETLN